MSNDQHPFSTLWQRISRIRLPDSEKRVMRETLVRYSTENPVHTTYTGMQYAQALWNIRLPHTRKTIAVSVLALVFVGSSTTAVYAAENALPGQYLYPVKVSVSEPLRGAITWGAADRAEWDRKVIERRLSEATRLAAEGKLAPELRESLESRIDSALASYDAHAQALLSDSVESIRAVSVESDLDADLEGRAHALHAISERNPRYAQQANMLAESIRSKHEERASKRAKPEAVLATSISKESGDEFVHEIRERAKNQVEQVRNRGKQQGKQDVVATASLMAVEPAQESSAADELESALSDADALIEQGDVIGAVVVLEAVNKAAKIANIQHELAEEYEHNESLSGDDEVSENDTEENIHIEDLVTEEENRN